jgi:hypothetical protein
MGTAGFEKPPHDTETRASANTGTTRAISWNVPGKIVGRLEAAAINPSTIKAKALIKGRHRFSERSLKTKIPAVVGADV